MKKLQDIFNLLDSFNLTEEERDFISGCDQFAIRDFFENVTTEEEVKEIIKEYNE